MAQSTWQRNGLGGVCVLKWPSQSPDLNPIENLWLDRRNGVHQCSPPNLAELEKMWNEDWKKMTKSKCTKLTETYPRQLKSEIAAKRQGLNYFFLEPLYVICEK